MCDLDDSATDIDRRWQRARKPHRCGACGETIRVGDRYHIAVSIQDGDFSSFQHCARCWWMVEELWAAGVEAVQWDLNCGETWDARDVPDEVAELAFLTLDEAQAQIASTQRTNASLNSDQRNATELNRGGPDGNSSANLEQRRARPTATREP